MNSLLSLGLDLANIITLIVGAAAFLAVIAVWISAVERNPMGARVKSLQERRDVLKASYVENKRRQSPRQIDRGLNIMKLVVRKMKLATRSQAGKLSAKLALAGFRNKDAIIIFLFFKLMSPALALLGAGLLVFGLKILENNPGGQGVLALSMLLIGFWVPNLFIKNQASKRQDAIRKSLPDALDLLVICAEAGLTLDAALNRVAREMTQASIQLADEFSLTAIELGFLPERRLALKNLAERVPLRSIRSVVATLIQTEKYGTPLAKSLRILSAEFRNQRMMKAEEKAARLPAIMTIPLILFILPTLFIVLLGPAACSVSDNLLNRGF